VERGKKKGHKRIQINLGRDGFLMKKRKTSGPFQVTEEAKVEKKREGGFNIRLGTVQCDIMP